MLLRMEHRWGERISVDLAVRIAARPFSVRTGRLVDVSLSGCAVDGGTDLRMLSRVQLAIVTPHRFTRTTPVISAYVVRRYAGGIGLEWCEFAPRAVIELLRARTLLRRERKLPVQIESASALSGHSLKHGT
jgi:hypothetical protein